MFLVIQTHSATFLWQWRRNGGSGGTIAPRRWRMGGTMPGDRGNFLGWFCCNVMINRTQQQCLLIVTNTLLILQRYILPQLIRQFDIFWNSWGYLSVLFLFNQPLHENDLQWKESLILDGAPANLQFEWSQNHLVIS